jgi:hypothetical protein
VIAGLEHERLAFGERDRLAIDQHACSGVGRCDDYLDVRQVLARRREQESARSTRCV